MARKKNSKTNGTAVKILKYGLIVVFFIFAGVFTVKQTLYWLTHANIFRISAVVRAPGLTFIESRYLNNLAGQNLFELDLPQIQRGLQAQYPEINNLRVIRRFPDKVYIIAKKREPLALAKLNSRSIVLDREGYVLSFEHSGKSLPEILGVSQDAQPVLGKPLREREISTALEIIDRFHQNEELHAQEIALIDVASLSKIGFQLTNELNVILDRENIEQKLSTLGILLTQGDINPNEINYIDLRFKEPILGKK